MSTEFVLFRTAGTNEPEPILINPAHVFAPFAKAVRLHRSRWSWMTEKAVVIRTVEGNLKSVWEKLTGKVSTVEALDEHLTWTRRDPEVDSGGH